MERGRASSIEVGHIKRKVPFTVFLKTKDGYLATGTSDSYDESLKLCRILGISSQVATDDNNGNVWLFGDIGSKTVAIVADEGITVEKLPEPLNIVPTYEHGQRE